MLVKAFYNVPKKVEIHELALLGAGERTAYVLGAALYEFGRAKHSQICERLYAAIEAKNAADIRAREARRTVTA